MHPLDSEVNRATTIRMGSTMEGSLKGGRETPGTILPITSPTMARGFVRDPVPRIPTGRRGRATDHPIQSFPLTWAAIVERFQVDMSLSIYCSNAIENVGCSFSITNRLCKAVFGGERPYIDHIDKRDQHYPGEIAKLKETGRGTDRLSIVRSRREVVQHAVTMRFLFISLVVENRLLDEDVIKYAHLLLMMYSEHEATGGVYRTAEDVVSHGLPLENDAEVEHRTKDMKMLNPEQPPPEHTTKPGLFSRSVRHASVPIYMEELVSGYARDCQGVKSKSKIVKIELASKCCKFFVCVHPFEDGNGRMCRLLMNTILLKYVGAIVAIGINRHERRKYIELALQVNRNFTQQERDGISWDGQSSHRTLSTTILRRLTTMTKSYKIGRSRSKLRKRKKSETAAEQSPNGTRSI